EWRGVIPRITRPTLIIGGRVSLVPWRSQGWMQEHIVGARVEVFEEHEGGNHHMVIEGDAKVKRLGKGVLGKHARARGGTRSRIPGTGGRAMIMGESERTAP